MTDHPTKVKACWWCRLSRNPDLRALYLGPGMMRDLDSDMSYGLPICGGCGGLGFVVGTAEFQGSARRISELRSAYCPIAEQRGLPPMPTALRHARLKELVEAVKEHYSRYGILKRTRPASYAQRIAEEGLLEPLLVKYEKDMAEEAHMFEVAEPRPHPAAELSRSAFIAAFRGEIDKAERIFSEAATRFPDDAVLLHDYAGFVLTFRRSFQQALPLFEQCLKGEPRLALHFMQAATYLALAGELLSARLVLSQARHCTDYEQCRDQITSLEQGMALVQRWSAGHN